MNKKTPKNKNETIEKEPRRKTPTFVVELPLVVNAGQAKHLRAHFEAARCLYNDLLGEANKRMQRMRADARWQDARVLPHTRKQERAAAFKALRKEYRFSEYDLHDYVKVVNCAWIADVPREGEAHLLPLCEELQPDARKKRRLARKLDRQRRVNNPGNYDQQGRIQKRGKGRLTWKNSKGYLATRHRLAQQERKLAAHRKSLHGRLVHDIIRLGNTILLEKVSYKAWQKRYGKSVGLRAPGMLIDHLKRTVANTGGILHEIPARTTKLSQYCHGCGKYVKKPLSQRWHHCSCGIGPVQRDLYSAFLAAFLNPADLSPSRAQYVVPWEGADLRLRAARERLEQRAKEGHPLPGSMGIPRARARLPQSLGKTQQELVYRRGRLEALS